MPERGRGQGQGPGRGGRRGGAARPRAPPRGGPGGGRRGGLAGGMTVAGAREVAAVVAEEGVPVVLMTYVTPVLAYDTRRFAADAAKAGVSGVIIPDLPAEEAEPVAGWLRSAGLDTI